MEKLPPEILRDIINYIPPSSQKAIRLCWRFLDAFILPRLFQTVKVNFAEKNIKKLQGIALSPHLAPLVRQLIWITSGTRDTHDDRHGHVNTWTGHEDYIKECRRRFFLCLDAMPNLHTFASELGPPDLAPERDEINGLVYALWPAMCRLQSKITSFRCQDPLNYLRWLRYECLQANGGQHTELSASFPTRHVLQAFVALDEVELFNPYAWLPKKNIEESLSRVPNKDMDPSGMTWKDTLKKLLRLDLRTDSAGGHWQWNHTPELMLKFFLEEAVNVREVSLRFRPTGTHSGPSSSSKWALLGILGCRWKFLRTIKFTFVMLPSTSCFVPFLKNHAETLKHILIHHCPGNERTVDVIRSAARVKDLQLHRFLVFPADQGYTEADEPRIVPERLVLDFVNKKDPSLDPFKEYMPSESSKWGTVTQKAASIYEEWPEDDGMHFTCRQCSDQG